MRSFLTMMLGAWVLLPFAGVAAEPVGAEDPPEVVFYAPASHRPAFGDVEVEVDVYAENVQQVIFLVDGEEVARLLEAPYRVTVSLGEDVGVVSAASVALDRFGGAVANG